MGKKGKTEIYYSLVGRAKSGWEVIFGDFDRRAVRDEQQSSEYSARMGGDRYYKRFKILETDGLQQSINHAVAKLNAEMVS